MVAVGCEPGREALRQGPGAFGGPDLVAGLDHPLAGLLEPAAGELLADHVRERERGEAALDEETHHLAQG